MSYKLFQGDTYYPNGGYGDFKGSHNTLEEALKALDSNADWYEIVHNDKIVQAGDILHRDDAERLKRTNTELVIGKPCIAGRGNTELIAWFKDERNNQVAVLKSLPLLTNIMPLHKIFPTKEVKVWFVQKWFDDGSFSGRWEWVEDATSKGEATKRAKELKRQGKGYHRSNYRTEIIKQ